MIDAFCIYLLLLHCCFFFETCLVEKLGLHTSDMLSKFGTSLSKTSLFLPHLFEMVKAVTMKFPPILNIITLRLFKRINTIKERNV